MKQSKPLSILLTDAELLPLFEPYIAKGHTVTVLTGYDFHVVMGKRAHRLSEAALREMPEKAVEMAVKGARAAAYPARKGKQ